MVESFTRAYQEFLLVRLLCDIEVLLLLLLLPVLLHSIRKGNIPIHKIYYKYNMIIANGIIYSAKGKSGSYSRTSKYE